MPSITPDGTRWADWLDVPSDGDAASYEPFANNRRSRNMTAISMTQKTNSEPFLRDEYRSIASIHVTVRDCSLGSILVAATERGVCAILLGDAPEALIGELRDHFPEARVLQGEEDFDRLANDVVERVEAPARGFDVPLDVRGTDFQCNVWDALREIPAGATASYMDVAKRIGAPTSARAVARACASNMLAIAIPCHRVVRADGGLSGYRWGVDRKRQLLEREAA